MEKSLSGKPARCISLRQLQVFEAVARQLGTRTAEELFLALPAVSNADQETGE